MQHYTPLDSGLALLPVTVIMLLFSARSGQLSARIGPRLQMSARARPRGRRPRPPRPRHRPRHLLDPGVPRRAPFRRRPRVHGGAAHGDGHGLRTGRALGHRVGGEQHGGAGGRSVRGGRASAGGGPDGGGRARRRPSWRLGSAPRCTSRAQPVPPAACWRCSRSATRPASRHLAPNPSARTPAVWAARRWPRLSPRPVRPSPDALRPLGADGAGRAAGTAGRQR